LGWAFDRTLVYGTGGVAWGLYKGQLMSGSNVNLESKVATGGVVGAGVEWKYSQNLSFRLEGLHYMFNQTFSGDSEPASGGFLKIHNADVIRLGASYHF
jgi:outer membrane immunogenic protein